MLQKLTISAHASKAAITRIETGRYDRLKDRILCEVDFINSGGPCVARGGDWSRLICKRLSAHHAPAAGAAMPLRYTVTARRTYIIPLATVMTMVAQMAKLRKPSASRWYRPIRVQ